MHRGRLEIPALVLQDRQIGTPIDTASSRLSVIREWEPIIRECGASDARRVKVAFPTTTSQPEATAPAEGKWGNQGHPRTKRHWETAKHTASAAE